jgi:hypothetical protein
MPESVSGKTTGVCVADNENRKAQVGIAGDRHGIDICEDVSTATAAHAAAGAARITDTEPKEEVTAEEVELDLTPGALEKINDPVRV